MTWSFVCECGVLVSAATDEELMAASAFHMEAKHPSVGVYPSRADVLAMAEWHDGPAPPAPVRRLRAVPRDV